VKLTVLCSDDCWSCRRNNEIELQSSELGGELGEALNASLRLAMRRDPLIDPRGLLGLRQQTAAFLLRLLRS